MKIPILFVTAIDWMIRENERDLGDLFPPVNVACSGFMVDDKDGEDGYIALSTEVIGKGKTCRHVLSIPKKCIVTMKVLETVDIPDEELIY